MGMTISDQASYEYGLYQYENSSAAKNNTVDSSAVAKKYYNISSISNAVDAMSGASSKNGYSLGSVNTYAVGLIQESQLSDYSTIKDNLKSSVQTALLSGSTDLSSLYSMLGFNAASTKDYLSILNSGTSSGSSSASAVDNYKKYLSSSTETSILNSLL
jgi:hypothetical protein